jgi:hypothetical protein
MNVGAGGANMFYALALSGTGTSPGIPTGDGLVVPLVADDWFYFSIVFANTSALPNFQGVLSQSGTANAAINIPPATLSGGLAFSTIYIGGAGYDLSLMRYSLVLESVPLVFLP